MRVSLWSAAIPMLLLLAGCKENSVPQDGTQNSGSAETVPADGNSGSGQVPTDGNSGTGQGDGSPPPPDTGDSGTSSAGEDEPYELPQPAVTTLHYAGPGEDHVHVNIAEAIATGDKVESDVWSECLKLRIEQRPDWCDGERLQESWDDIGDAIDSLDEEQYDNRDIYRGSSELRFSDRGVDYGDLRVQARVLELPSTQGRAQVSRFVTASADWTGYPGYLVVETGMPDGAPTVPSGVVANGTQVRIYGQEDANDWNDKHKRGNTGDPQLLVDQELGSGDRYYFRLPPDSPYWQMDAPVHFTIEISQWVTVTRNP